MGRQARSPRDVDDNNPFLTTPLSTALVSTQPVTKRRTMRNQAPLARAAGGRDLEFRIHHIELCIINQVSPTSGKGTPCSCGNFRSEADVA